jgi:Flp pilus assembly pilin Flp
MTRLKTLVLDDSGQGFTEYAILMGTIALSTILVLTAIGTRLQDVFGKLARELEGLPSR